MPAGPTELRRRTALALLAALLAVAAGLTGLAGMMIGSETLTRLAPTFAALQPATGIGLMLSGAGVAALLFVWRRLAQILGVLAVAIAVSRLIPWLLDIPVPILGSAEPWAKFLPGRVAPVTALGLLLSGSTLVCLASPGGFALRPVLTGTMAATVGALGLAAICGYLSGLSARYVPELPLRMALLAAIAFVALGASLFYLAWIDGCARRSVQRWVPWPIGVGGAVAALALWGAMRTWEDMQLRRSVAEAADHARTVVTNRVQYLETGLYYLARQWAASLKIAKEVRKAEEELAHWRDRGLLGLARFDGVGRVQKTLPGFEPIPGLDNAAARDRLFHAAAQAQQSMVTPLPGLTGGFALAIPLRLNEKFEGCLLAALRWQALVTPEAALPGCVVALRVGGADVYHSGDHCAEVEPTWVREVPLELPGGPWSLRIWPTLQHLAERRSTLPQVTLAASLVMAFLLALAVHLAQTTRLRARAAVAAEREAKGAVSQRLRIEEELRQSEARFRQLVENAADAIFVCGLDRRIVEINQRACDSLGYTRAELLTLSVPDIEVCFDLTAHADLVERLDRGLPVTIEGVHRRRDGSTFPVEVRISTGRWDSRLVRLSIVRDITERKRAEEVLRWRARLSALGADVGAALAGTNGLPVALEACMAAVVRHLDAAFARIWTLNEAEQVLELQASAGLYTHTNGPHSRIKVGDLKIGLIAQEGKPHLTNDVQNDPRVGDRAWAQREGMVSFAGYPLRIGGRVVGVMALFARQPLSDAILEALAGVADELATYLNRRWAEEALREQKALLQHILDNIPCAVFWKDRQSVYLGGNEICARNLGRSAADLPGKTDRELCPDPDEAEFYVHCDREVMESGWPMLNIEETQLRPDGRREVLLTSKVPLRNERGEVTGLLGVYTDISSRKRAEEAVRVSEGRYRGLVEGSLQGVLIHRGGKILFANPAVAHMLGCERPADLVGTEMDALIPPEERGRLRDRRDAVLRGEPIEPYVEWQAIRRDGLRIWVHTSLVTIPFDGETALASFWIDITERKRLEEQFVQAQRLEAVGRLAGGVAHDFNNLLTVINGFAELVLAGLPREDPATGMVGEIRKAGERAAELTRQLLAYGRKTILMPKVLDLNAVVRAAAPMLRRVLGERIELLLELSPSVGPVKADPGQLEQVLLNLVVNARDAMPLGGTLTVSTAEEVLGEPTPPGGPEAPKAGLYRRLTVRDTGVGMDEATRARVFEPFFTTKGLGEGTGLGLAMVYGIVKASGGHISVESAPGFGAAFSIYLPAAPEAAHPELAALPPAIAPGRETLLVVEDEEGVSGITRLALETAGYQVLLARDGLDALALSDGHPGSIELLVTDVVMPRLGGPQLAEELVRRRPGLRVLFVSGHTREQSVPADAAFLQKPFTPSALTAKVREVLDEGRATSAGP